MTNSFLQRTVDFSLNSATLTLIFIAKLSLTAVLVGGIL
jgi:hypothetical protein